MYISSINLSKKNYNEPRHSVSFGNNHFLKYVNLLKQGSLKEIKGIRNLQVLGQNGESLLHIAAAISSLEIVSYLAEHINVNQKDMDGNTSLSVAVNSGRLDVVKHLYSRGANLNSQDSLGTTPIMKSLNNNEIFDFLLSQGVNLEFQNSFGNRLIHMVWDDKDKLLKLKENKVNLNSIDGNGQNLVHYSVDANNIDLLNFYLEIGISPDVPDFYNETPIFKTKNLQIIETLKNKKVNLNQQNNMGDTRLHKAIKQGDNKIVDFLLGEGVDVNIKNKLGETPAFYIKDEKTLLRLINLGLDIDSQNNKGEALVHKFAQSGDIQIFSQLVDSSANIQTKNIDGLTPKDIAQKFGNSAILDFYETGNKGFSKVVGMNDLKEELRRSVIEPIKNKAKYRRYGLDAMNGVLLHGLPGCGKTFIATALAEECGRSFYQLKGSDIASPYQGEGTLAVKRIFNAAKANAPSIIFIDEIEGIAPNREFKNPDSSSQDMTERVNELLQQMNSLSKNDIFVIGATNHPEKVDKAVKRPGRLDKKIYIGPPDMIARAGLFRKQLENRPCEPKIDYKKLAQKTENYIAEEIKNIVNDAAKVALIQERNIKMSDLLTAISKNKPSITKADVQKYMQKISVADSGSVINVEDVDEKTKGFKKVAGMNELKESLINDVIIPLKKPELAAKYGLKPINGVLLYGPPGTGKTFIAKAFAEESERYFMMIKPSDILSSYHGESTLNIRKFFEQAEYNAPAVIFIDEIEALAPKRVSLGGGETSTQVTELLQQLNDCAKKNIFVIAATNEPQNIDDAIVRVGRFDKTVFVGPPDLDAREELFRRGLEDIYTELNIDYKKLAEMTEYFTAAEINQLVIRAAAQEAFQANIKITEKMLIDNIKKVQPNLNKNKVELYRNKVKKSNF